MNYELYITGDGSHTVVIPDMNVSYHSIRGAVQESLHIYIETGLEEAFRQFPDAKMIDVFEVGFGTGLNALLAMRTASAQGRQVRYQAVERYPLNLLVSELNYPQYLGGDCATAFAQMHEAAWGQAVAIGKGFWLLKKEASLLELSLEPDSLHVVFFDAFAPDAQPELWTEAVFGQLYLALKANGLLVTYCSKGIVRRRMAAAGFTIEKLDGPLGKREIVRARKLPQ